MKTYTIDKLTNLKVASLKKILPWVVPDRLLKYTRPNSEVDVPRTVGRPFG